MSFESNFFFFKLVSLLDSRFNCAFKYIIRYYFLSGYKLANVVMSEEFFFLNMRL